MKRRIVLWNISSSVLSQLVSVAISLVLPPLMISTYGSIVNGIVSSVRQFVRYFSILEGGVVAAAGANLFRPVAMGNTVRVNEIFSAVSRFFRKSGWLLLIGSVAFSLLFPLSLYGSPYFASGILISALSTSIPVLGYLVFFKYHLILSVHQKSYLVVNSLAATNFFVTVIQVILISSGIPVVAVIAVAPVVGIVRLILTRWYVLRKFPYLDPSTPPDMSSLDQKWDSVAINVSRMLKSVVPIIFLTTMFGFEYASIFNVYVVVFAVGSSIIESAGNNLTASMASYVVAGRAERVARAYQISHVATYYLVSFLAACFTVLFLPFIDLYVNRLSDLNYLSPFLAVTFVLNESLLNLRFAPNMLIRSVGHYRQTRNSAFAEVILVALVTPVGAMIVGYEGILLGALLGSVYRTWFVTRYARREILRRTGSRFLLSACGALLSSSGTVLLLRLASFDVSTFFAWTVTASVTLGVATVLTAATFWMFNRSELVGLARFVSRGD